MPDPKRCPLRKCAPARVIVFHIATIYKIGRQVLMKHHGARKAAGEEGTGPVRLPRSVGCRASKGERTPVAGFEPAGIF